MIQSDEKRLRKRQRQREKRRKPTTAASFALNLSRLVSVFAYTKNYAKTNKVFVSVKTKDIRKDVTEGKQ